MVVNLIIFLSLILNGQNSQLLRSNWHLLLLNGGDDREKGIFWTFAIPTFVNTICKTLSFLSGNVALDLYC
jgi:hypothetical protein